MHKNHILVALLLLNLALLPGCNWLNSSPPPESPEITSGAEQELRPTEIAPEKIEKAEPALELIWKIPDEPVDEYLIRFGDDPGALKSERRVRSAQVKSIQDSRHGSVYHYLLDGIPDNSIIYVSLTAIRAGVESPPSKIFKVSPAQPNAELK